MIEMLVVHTLTNASELPCSEPQFDSSKPDFNLHVHTRSRPYHERRQPTFSFAMTIICVFSVIATMCVVGLLYLKKSNLNKFRKRIRGFGQGQGRSWTYTLAGNSGPEYLANQFDEFNDGTRSWTYTLAGI